VTGPLIAVTSGDPAGIGPEIMARAAAGLRGRVADGEFSLLLIGARLDTPGSAENNSGSTIPRRRSPPRSLALIYPRSLSSTSTRPKRTFRQADRPRKAAALLTTRSQPPCALRLRASPTPFARANQQRSSQLRGPPLQRPHGASRRSHRRARQRDAAGPWRHAGGATSPPHTALEDVPKRVTPDRISRVVALTDEALKALRVSAPPHRHRGAQSACGRRRSVRTAGHRHRRTDHPAPAPARL